jgi:hypothetical protein
MGERALGFIPVKKSSGVRAAFALRLCIYCDVTGV